MIRAIGYGQTGTKCSKPLPIKNSKKIKLFRLLKSMVRYDVVALKKIIGKDRGG